MSRIIAALAAGIAMLLPTVVAAEQATPRPPAPTFTPRPAFTPPLDRSVTSGNFQSEVFRENLTRQAAQITPERRSRAERIARLVDQGECSDAERLARRERDTVMANRIAEVCVPGVGLRAN